MKRLSAVSVGSLVRPRRGSGSGQALAEMVIILPILMLLIFGIIEMSNAWRTFQVVTNVAREGARVAILPMALSASAHEDSVRTVMQGGLTANGLTNSASELIVECNGADGVCQDTGDQQRIRIEYPYTFRTLTPVVTWVCGSACAASFGTITIASTTIMRKE